MRQLRGKLLAGGLWALAGKAVSIVCAFVLNLVLARALNPADYGAYFVVLTTMIVLATVGTLGMDQVVVRFVARCLAVGTSEHVATTIRRCYLYVIVCAACLTVALYFAARPLFGSVMKIPQVVPLVGLVMLWLFASTLGRQTAETFRGFNDIRGATLYGGLRNNGILISVTTCAAAVVLSYLHRLTLATAFGIMAAGAALVLATALLDLRRKMRGLYKPSRVVNKPELSTLRTLVEGWPLGLAMLITVLNNQGAGWLAALFDTPSHVALFGIAQRFVLLIIAPTMVVNAVLPPVIASLQRRGELSRIEEIIRLVTGLACIPCFLAFLVLLVMGKPLLGHLFGDYYRSAYPLLLVLCAGQLVNIATGAWLIVLPMTGLKKEMLKISALGICIQLSAGVVGGYYFGVDGIALAYTIDVIIINMVGMMMVRRKLGIWTYLLLSQKVPRVAIDTCLTVLRATRSTVVR